MDNSTASNCPSREPWHLLATKPVPTLRGVGIVEAKSKTQINRYSAISKEGVAVSFLDATNTFEGWKSSLRACLKMWRRASLPAVEGGILPSGRIARRLKRFRVTMIFFMATRFRRAGSLGSTSAKMADATIFRHALNGKNTWVHFNRVDFGTNGLKSVNVRSASTTGGLIEIRLDKADGPVLAKVEIGKGSEWKDVNAKLDSVPTGVHDLVVTQSEDNNVELDWIGFE